MKRGLPVYKIKTVPRRQRYPESMKWNSETSVGIDDDYEGTYNSTMLKEGPIRILDFHSSFNTF